MATIENVSLIDDIRKDALLLMQSRGIDYVEAYNIAKDNLIGNSKVTEFEAQPFEVSIDESLLSNTPVVEKTVETNVDDKLTDEDDVIDENIPYYKNYILEHFNGKVNIKEYSYDQLKSIVVAHQMGAPIEKFLSPKYSNKQIDFIAIVSVTGNDVDKYVGNYDFNVDEESFLVFGEDALREIAKENVAAEM